MAALLDGLCWFQFLIILIERLNYSCYLLYKRERKKNDIHYVRSTS